MANYSRLSSVEEKRNIKKAVTFVILTLVSLVLLFFIGIPLLGRFTGFVSDLGKSNKPIGSTDKTPPAPPKFNTTPDFTNQTSVEISGNTESGATVKLTINGREVESLSNKDGKFTVNVDLRSGDNNFSAYAVDPAGNVGQKTDDFKIVFDNKVPDLTIDSPADGSQFFGTKQKQVTIQGTTEPDTQVTINDRIISVDGSGKFQYSSSMGEGENKFNIKVTDQAGNLTEKDVIFTFSS